MRAPAACGVFTRRINRTLSLLAAGTALAVVAAPGASPSTGNPTLGKRLFVSSGCGACHTMKPAGSKGTMGPNLDVYQPPYSFIVTQVTHGGGGMPAFQHRLSKAQIADVAAFVYRWTSRP